MHAVRDGEGGQVRWVQRQQAQSRGVRRCGGQKGCCSARRGRTLQSRRMRGRGVERLQWWRNHLSVGRNWASSDVRWSYRAPGTATFRKERGAGTPRAGVGAQTKVPESVLEAVGTGLGCRRRGGRKREEYSPEGTQ